MNDSYMELKRSMDEQENKLLSVKRNQNKNNELLEELYNIFFELKKDLNYSSGVDGKGEESFLNQMDEELYSGMRTIQNQQTLFNDDTNSYLKTENIKLDEMQEELNALRKEQ
ncbi:MAG: hypothetical protein PHH04_01690 [Thomasclavelia sp.]|nr:hypothetical protein [Thomasclavelia sp.]